MKKLSICRDTLLGSFRLSPARARTIYVDHAMGVALGARAPMGARHGAGVKVAHDERRTMDDAWLVRRHSDGVLVALLQRWPDGRWSVSRVDPYYVPPVQGTAFRPHLLMGATAPEALAHL